MNYDVYLKTVAAEAELHGVFRIEKTDTDGIHTTSKKPLGQHGVLDFKAKAKRVILASENHLLGRRFGEGNIIGIDCDGWIPDSDWTKGTGYREISASGTGAHIICRITGEIPKKNKIVMSKDKNPEWHLKGDTELFLGNNSAIALTGEDAVAGDIDLEPSSDCAKLICSVLEITEAQLKSEMIKCADEELPLEKITNSETLPELPELVKSKLLEIELFLSNYARADNSKIKNNPSEGFFQIVTWIAKKLADIELNTGFEGVLCFDRVRDMWLLTDYYQQKYFNNPNSNYHDKKEKITIEKAIRLATEKKEKYKGGPKTLHQISEIIADSKEYTKNYQKIIYCDKKSFIYEWQRHAHIAVIKDTKGYAWFNGVEWKIDPNGREIDTEIKHCLNLIDEYGIGTGYVKDVTAKIIASYRCGDCAVSLNDCYGCGLTCIDGTIIIDDKIHFMRHKPEFNIWFGSVPISYTDLLPNLEKMTKEDILSHFPKFEKVLSECGDDKVDLMITLAGVAIYYTMPNHKSLDAWYYLWDDNIAGTGKTTHMKEFLSFFDKYISAGLTWKTFTGQNAQNGSLFGKIGIECEEAGVNQIPDVEAIKSRTSGGWELKKLFEDPVGINEPLLMISLGNVKPLLKSVTNTPAIWDRLQPCEFTIKHRGTSDIFDCSRDEYHKALLNLGCWVAYNITKSKNISKMILPFYVSPEDVQSVCEWIPFEKVLYEIGYFARGQVSGLKQVLDAVKLRLREMGYDDLRGASCLKSEESFRNWLNGRTEYASLEEITKNSTKLKIKVVLANPAEKEKRSLSRYWIQNYGLNKEYLSDEERLEYQKYQRKNETS